MISVTRIISSLKIKQGWPGYSDVRWLMVQTSANAGTGGTKGLSCRERCGSRRGCVCSDVSNKDPSLIYTRSLILSTWVGSHRRTLMPLRHGCLWEMILHLSLVIGWRIANSNIYVVYAWKYNLTFHTEETVNITVLKFNVCLFLQENIC